MAHKGRTALVTGGAGGLGRAIAENFISEGANVVICDINQKLLEEFEENVVSKNPGNVLAVECDITSETALDGLFAQIESKFGPLDYAVNSAGLVDKFHAAGTLERSEWDLIIAVNLTAPTFVTKRAINSFLKSGKKGSIVNIASVAAFKGFVNGAAYTASKHGLIGLTKNTAAYYREKDIRCNAIQAGAMKTNINSRLMDGFNMDGMKLCQKTFPEELLGDERTYADIAKVAKLVAFLCSDDASMISGATVTADGAMTAA